MSIGGAAASWDSKGNLTSDPTTGKSYGYDSENRLRSASGGVSVYYDPLGRMTEYDTSVSSRFMFDGPEVVVEVDNPTSAVTRRYVRGDGPDELLMWYEGSGSADRRFLSTDERGSVISASDSSGALIAINSYDEYGRPGASNIGRFQYTGHKWLPEANLYDYKARDYLPHLGIFAQTDPVGEGGSPNLYAYVLDDPISGADPFGLQCNPQQSIGGCGEIVAPAHRSVQTLDRSSYSPAAVKAEAYAANTAMLGSESGREGSAHPVGLHKLERILDSTV